MAEPANLAATRERLRRARELRQEQEQVTAPSPPPPAQPPAAYSEFYDVGLDDVEDTSVTERDRARKYWEKSVQTAVDTLLHHPQGGRNDELNRQIHNVVANAVYYGFDYDGAVELIKTAALRNASGEKMTKREVERSANSGITGGKKHPRAIPLSQNLPNPETVVVTFPELPEPDYKADTGEEDEIKGADFPTYDWKEVLPDKNTFLDAYCAEAFKISIPREFQLFVALQILGNALSRRVAIKRIENPTYGNIAICLTANSASGKGRTMSLATSVLRQAVPFDDTPITSGMEPDGVLVHPLPSSGEQLVRDLAVSIIDKNTQRVITKLTCSALITFSEMDKFIAKSGQGGSNNSYKSFIEDFTDCHDEISTSAVSTGRAVCYNAFVSFLTSTQPGHLRSQFTHRDRASGLLNRFIFVFGRGVKQPAFEVIQIDRAKPASLLREIYDWSRGGLKNHPLQHNNDPESAPGYWYRDDAWSPAARSTYAEFIDRIIDPECERNVANSDILGRMRVNVLRLILLFAANALSKTIEVEHVNSAIALYPYMRDCAMLLSTQVRETERSENLQMIIDAVEKHESKHGQPPTRNDLNRLDARIKNMNAEDFTNATEKLIRSKQLHTVLTGRKSGAGRVGIRYSSIPAEEWKRISQTVKLKSDK